MIRSPIKKSWKVALGIVAVLAMIGGYFCLSACVHAKIPDDTTVPAWSQFGEGIRRFLTPDAVSGESWLLTDARATLIRLFLGLAVGVIGAITIGLLMGCSKTFVSILLPPLTFLATIPPTAALAVRSEEHTSE